jgi:type I restriction enzyme S subunit
VSSSVPTAKLADIADLNPPLAASLSDGDDVSFMPMAAVDADSVTASDRETRHYSEVSKGYTPFLDGDVLIAKITPCFENGKIAQARLSRRYGFGSTEFHVVRPRGDRADARYLVHFLRQDRIRKQGESRMTGSAGQRRVPEHFLAGLTVPLPPLPEQRRIAEILDKADALRAKRRAAIAQLDTLTQSIFLDMFGDPATQGWRTITIGGIAADSDGAIRTGPFGSQLLHGEFTDDGIAVLGIDNVVENEFRWGQRRFVSEAKYRQLFRYTVHPGDVLITIMGTCGRCAIVPDDIPKAINTKHLCCITLDHTKCLPSFLHAYFLGHPIARRYLAQKAKGAIMEGLNMGIIKEMPIPLVPIEFQQEFGKRLKQVSALKVAHRRSEAAVEGLFASLQHRAFQGDL